MASILRAKDIQSEALHTTYAKSPALFKDTAYICSAIFGRSLQVILQIKL